jgi:predicted NAD/FAD-binding protein
MRSMLDFPAASFVRFFHNHGLLQVSGRPQWRTVTGGSREYVRRMIRDFRGQVRLNAPVAAVARDADGVRVTARGGSTERFDHVVIAAHGDQALGVLADPTRLEREVLSGFRYQPNRAVLHRDPRLMPRRKAAWASWNYLAESGGDAAAPAAVTYWMNRLQSLEGRPDVFVSLNPNTEPQEELIERDFWYDHPQFDSAALEAQRRLPAVQGINRTWFCGSYHGHGFHEDAFSAGLSVAAALGAPAPWYALPDAWAREAGAGLAAAA